MLGDLIYSLTSDINSEKTLIEKMKLKFIKMKKLNIIGIFALTAALFVGCAKTDFEVMDPSKLTGDSIPTTFTIAQLDQTFDTDSDAYSDTIKYLGGLYTAKLIQANQDVVISGYITSSDVDGNIYKNIVIQEAGPNARAIKVSIDAGSLSGILQVGQQVWLKCNGLYLGRYGEALQIGLKYINLTKMKVKVITYNKIYNNGVLSKIDTIYNTTIYRIEPGRIPLPIVQSDIHSYGLPNPSVIKADTMTIAQIRAMSGNRDALINKLVCIKNAYFTGASAGVPLSGTDLIFAPSTNGAGYPQSRDITDGTGTIVIATSEYAKFATYPLPTSNYRGNITVIIGWYRNYTTQTGDWQLTLRSVTDLGKGFEGYVEQYKK
jgi:hypothetical protein